MRVLEPVPVALVLILSFGKKVFDLLDAICGVHRAAIHLINYCLDHRGLFFLIGSSEQTLYLFDSGIGREFSFFHLMNGLTNVLKKLHVFLVRFSKLNGLYGVAEFNDG